MYLQVHVTTMAPAKGPPFPTSSLSSQPMMNGRPLDKAPLIQSSNVPNGRVPSFTKPTKSSHEAIPGNHPPPPPPPSTPKDVESILKMMTSTVDPLSQIAATPRNEIIEMHSQRQHKYVDFPPLFKPEFKPPIKPCMCQFNTTKTNRNYLTIIILLVAAIPEQILKPPAAISLLEPIRHTSKATYVSYIFLANRF